MVYYFIDESGEGFHTSGFAAMCCITIIDPTEFNLGITKLKDDILHDPHYQNISGALVTEGFHYSRDHREIKNKFIDFLRFSDFQAYICFDPNANGDFNNIYNRLFGRLLIDRLRDHRTQKINIFFEQHGKAENRLSEIEKIIVLKIDEIKKNEKRGFSGSINLKCAGKENVCLSIADYVCGIFKAYYDLLNKKSESNAEEVISKRDYDDLSMKIRCIHNITKDEFYWRKNPFPGKA